MSEFIGSRISLVSKSDIRYVGTLHEINSETSTVALEQVTSFGTEGRRSNPEDEIAPSDSVYEYIVFRGSDVKDLRIEEAPKENLPPQVPNDPAILGSGSRPPVKAQATEPPTNQPQQPQQPIPQQQRPNQPQYPQQGPPPPYFYPPPGQQFGPRGGPPPGPGGPGFPPMPYGAPPGWYPPPGQAFPPYMGYLPPQMPHGLPGQLPQGPKPPQANNSKPNGDGESKPQPGKQVTEKQQEVKPPSKPATPAAAAPATRGPPPPLASKPSVSTALAPVEPKSAQASSYASKAASSAPKSGRIMPAVPLANTTNGVGKSATAPATRDKNVKPGQPQQSQAAANAAIQSANQAATAAVAAAMAKLPSAAIQSKNQAATAAVAAAMAKLPQAPGLRTASNNDAIDNLTKKVNDMRTNDSNRNSRQPGNGNYPNNNHRGGRGRGNQAQQTRKVDVPKTDYDFQSANAKFNKQDLVKEAIATGSPLGSPTEATPATGRSTEASINGSAKGTETPIILPSAATYNKSASFFDNISSEIKERAEGAGPRPGGREWRGEEQKKNLETFGQGSVDNGYRGGFRGGRGRGRGYGRGRGRGGGFRGGRGGSVAPETPAGNTAVTAST